MRRTWSGCETFGPPLDHMALLVTSADGDRWLADVGFGDHSVYPLPWRAGTDIEDPGGVFRLSRVPDGDWDIYRDGKLQYRIDPHPRALADFDAMCWYQATSPRSHFTRSLVCSRRTPQGRVTLSGRRLVTTTADGRAERELGDDGAVLEAYQTIFGITLERVPPQPY